MKAVVVELNRNQAAVLSDDGCILTVKNNSYEIGQEIQLNPPSLNLIKKITVFAASAAASVILGVGTWAYASPYSYVSMDINPSIEFSINRFDRVIKVNSLNEDGKNILNALSLNSLTNKSISEAVTKTVEQISASGYFADDKDGGIIIATSCKSTEKADKLAQELQETVANEVIQTGDTVEIETFRVEPEQVKEAKELGVTPGKLNLVEKLQEAAEDQEDIKVEDWLDKPVKEIKNATKDYVQNAKSSSAATASSEAADHDNQESKKDNQEGKELSKADKDVQKAQADAQKAKEKAKAAKKNAKEKVKEAREKAKKAEKENHTKYKDAAKIEAKEAQKAAEAALKEAIKAMREAEKAQKKADKDDQKTKNQKQDTKNKNDKSGWNDNSLRYDNSIWNDNSIWGNNLNQNNSSGKNNKSDRINNLKPDNKSNRDEKSNRDGKSKQDDRSSQDDKQSSSTDRSNQAKNHPNKGKNNKR